MYQNERFFLKTLTTFQDMSITTYQDATTSPIAIALPRGRHRTSWEDVILDVDQEQGIIKVQSVIHACIVICTYYCHIMYISTAGASWLTHRQTLPNLYYISTMYMTRCQDSGLRSADQPLGPTWQSGPTCWCYTHITTSLIYIT